MLSPLALNSSIMRLFWKLIKLSFQRQITYRAATVAGLITNFFFGLLRVAVLLALYDNRTEVAGMSPDDAVTFTALTQAIIAYLSIFGWYDLMNSVYTGDVAGDLLKPTPYFLYWLGRDLGRAAATLLLRGLTIMLVYALFFPITMPTSFGQWIAVGFVLLLALLVSFAWRFWVNLAAFWTPNAVGIGRLAFGLGWTLSGFFMPLRFFPDWFVRLCHLTPFPSMVNTVVETYLGLLRGRELIQAISWQLFWSAILILLAQLTLRAGISRLVIQGG